MDWLYGMNFTRATLAANSTIPVGRVMTLHLKCWLTGAGNQEFQTADYYELVLEIEKNGINSML